MPNNHFTFKQFTIHQQQSTMKVGTDGVLLGAWANQTDAHSILDIGAGSGLLSLMLAQKTNATITAIEIDSEAYQDAKNNALQSTWSQRICVINTDFTSFVRESGQTFDLIISNPPYFNNALKSQTLKKSLARHTDSLPHQVLIEGVSMLLNDNGMFYVILPASNSKSFIAKARICGLHPKNILQVYSKQADKKPIRALMQFSRFDIKADEHSLHIRDEKAQYSEEYKALTKEYYLAF